MLSTKRRIATYMNASEKSMLDKWTFNISVTNVPKPYIKITLSRIVIF